MGNAARGLLHADFRDERAEEVAVFGEGDVFRGRADDPGAGLFKPFGEVEWRLAAILHDYAVAFLAVVDLHHVLEGQRLEVELVRGVIVGRDGLGIRIDHHHFVAALPQGECRMATAPVELDALADAVGPAT